MEANLVTEGGPILTSLYTPSKCSSKHHELNYSRFHLFSTRVVEVLQCINLLMELLTLRVYPHYCWRSNKSVWVKDTNTITSFCTSRLAHVLPSAWNLFSPPKNSNLFFSDSHAESPSTFSTLHQPWFHTDCLILEVAVFACTHPSKP